MPSLSVPMVFAIVAAAGVFLFFLGLNQARRSAGGSEDFQARMDAYGVTTTAGASQLPSSAGFRDTLNHLFQPAADRMGRGDVKKGKPSVAEQLQRADLKLRTSEYFMIQLGSTAVFFLIGWFRWGRIQGEISTLTAQARASGTLITALPIILAAFMYFVTPTYFRPMFGSIIGWILLVIGGFMIFVGNLIIRRVVAIEV